MSLLIGNEGVGKGTLVAWLIARITRGELPGHLRHKPSVVGILGDEDSFDGVWTPRLYAADADLSLVRRIQRPDGGFVNLREDRDALALAADLEQIRVLFFDQLLDNLGAGTDDFKQKAVREALQPLRAIAREFGLAAFGSLHPNKKGDTFRQLVSGAAAFNAVSRSSLLLEEHPGDEGRRVLVRGKGNLSVTPPAFEFGIVSHKFTANDHDFDVPRAVDFSESGLTVDDLIGQPVELPQAGEARTTARTLVAEELADGDWQPAGPIIEACEQQSIHKRAAQRAAKDLGVEKEWRGFPAASHWRLAQGRQGGDSRVSPVAPVTPVTAAGSDMALTASDDSYDRRDSERTDDSPVTAALGQDEGWNDDLPEGWTLDEIEGIVNVCGATETGADPGSPTVAIT